MIWIENAAGNVRHLQNVAQIRLKQHSGGLWTAEVYARCATSLLEGEERVTNLEIMCRTAEVRRLLSSAPPSLFGDHTWVATRLRMLDAELDAERRAQQAASRVAGEAADGTSGP